MEVSVCAVANVKETNKQTDTVVDFFFFFFANKCNWWKFARYLIIHWVSGLASIPGHSVTISCCVPNLQGDHVVVIHGLKLNLAEWHPDKGLVCGSLTQQHNVMPDLHCWVEEKHSDVDIAPEITGTRTEEGEIANVMDYYDCPLYSTTEQSSLLGSLPLKTVDSLGSCQLLRVSLSLTWIS